MIITSYVLLDLLAAAVLYILMAFRWYRKGTDTMISKTCLFMSVLLILLCTLSPIIKGIFSVNAITDGRFNLIPFVDWYYHYGEYRLETLLNILLFVPFGMAHIHHSKGSWTRTVIIGMIFSMFIECVQPMLSSFRVCDISDIITNTFGTLIGALLYLRISRGRQQF